MKDKKKKHSKKRVWRRSCGPHRIEAHSHVDRPVVTRKKKVVEPVGPTNCTKSDCDLPGCNISGLHSHAGSFDDVSAIWRPTSPATNEAVAEENDDIDRVVKLDEPVAQVPIFDDPHIDADAHEKSLRSLDICGRPYCERCRLHHNGACDALPTNRGWCWKHGQYHGDSGPTSEKVGVYREDRPSRNDETPLDIFGQPSAGGFDWTFFIAFILILGLVAITFAAHRDTSAHRAVRHVATKPPPHVTDTVPVRVESVPAPLIDKNGVRIAPAHPIDKNGARIASALRIVHHESKNLQVDADDRNQLAFVAQELRIPGDALAYHAAMVILADERFNDQLLFKDRIAISNAYDFLAATK